MESSSTLKVKKVILPPSGDIKQRIIVHSKHTQIGNDNKAYVDAARYVNNDEVKTEVIHPSENAEKVVEIEGDFVQVVTEGNDSRLHIELSSQEADSTIQTGDKSVLSLVDRGSGNEGDSVHKRSKQRRNGTNRRPQRQKKRQQPFFKTHESISAPSLPSDASRSLYKKFFEDVQAVLHPLRDDGKWDLFNDKLNEFRARHGRQPEWDILLSLEEAQQMCYHSTECNGVQAVKILCDTLKTLPRRLRGFDPSIMQLCEGRAYCYLASVYRHHKGKYLGKADKCLKEAERSFKGTEYVYDQATVYYERASTLLESFPRADHCIREYLDKCAELCDEINKDGKCWWVKKGHFARLKKAMVILNCSSKEGRKRRISDENLKEAKKCLLELETGNGTEKEVPISERLQCLLVQSDEAFRRGCHVDAKKIIEKAITLAKEHGFDEKPALKRLDDLESMPSGAPSAVTQDQESSREPISDENKSTGCCSGDGDVSANTSEDTE